MKTLKKIQKYLIINAIIFFPALVAKAQIIDTTKMNEVSGEFAQGAGFTNVPAEVIVSQVIGIVLSLLGLIFLVLTIMAGFKWMNAGGNEEEVNKAKTSLKNSIIGLVIVLYAYAITYFLFNK